MSNFESTYKLDRLTHGVLALGIFPPFLRIQLVEDRSFREQLQLNIRGTLVFDDGSAKFHDHALFKTIREVLDGGGLSTVEDQEGSSYTVSLNSDGDGRLIVGVHRGELNFRLSGFGVLSLDPGQRLKELERSLEDAGLPPYAAQDWQVILEERPLHDDEFNAFSEDFSIAPQPIVAALKEEISDSHVKLSTIAPAKKVYYERLIGAGEAQSVTELAGNISRSHIAGLLAWNSERGAENALALASYAGIVTDSPLTELPPAALLRLGEWAQRHGDVLAKVGMIELGLAIFAKVPQLESIIEALAREVISLDPTDPSGRLSLLSAAFVLCDGELSRTKVLEAWPPFRRRHAALAQAALFERSSFGRINTESFRTWAFGLRAHRFYLQTLVDMRLEPRWPPDYAAPEQLHREFIGRVYNASRQHASSVPEGSLHNLLFDESSPGLLRALELPGSLVPGPLEGACEKQGSPPPPDFQAILDESLANEQLEPRSVTALINLRGLFQIGSQEVTKAVTLIRKAGHRFASSLAIEDRDSLIAGLANLASTTRNQDLASDVRMMMRKIRVDGLTPVDAGCELMIALHAAAAFEELDGWLKFVGDWSLELTLNVSSREEARDLLTVLNTLCVIEPPLRRTVGCALAALSAYLQI